MTTKDFFELVSEMRNAQKNFYKTRDKKWLVIAKQLETQVDDIVTRAMRYYAE